MKVMTDESNNVKCIIWFSAGFKPSIAMPPRKSWKSWIFFLKIPGPGKSWKLKKVLETSGNISLKITHFLLVIMENKQK